MERGRLRPQKDTPSRTADVPVRKKATQQDRGRLRPHKSNPYITRKTLAENLEISHSAIQKHINKLKESGVIRRIGSDKDSHWEIQQ